MEDPEREYWIRYCAQQRDTLSLYRGIVEGMQEEEDSLREKFRITDDEIFDALLEMMCKTKPVLSLVQ